MEVRDARLLDDVSRRLCNIIADVASRSDAREATDLRTKLALLVAEIDDCNAGFWMTYVTGENREHDGNTGP